MCGLRFSRRMCYADYVADELPKDGFAPRLGHAGAAPARSLVCSGGNRGQGVRGEMGMNSGKGHRSSEIRIILSEARLAGQRGQVQQHSEGPFFSPFLISCQNFEVSVF